MHGVFVRSTRSRCCNLAGSYVARIRLFRGRIPADAQRIVDEKASRAAEKVEFRASSPDQGAWVKPLLKLRG